MDYRNKMIYLATGIGAWLFGCNAVFVLMAEQTAIELGLVNAFSGVSMTMTMLIILFVIKLVRMVDIKPEDILVNKLNALAKDMENPWKR